MIFKVKVELDRGDPSIVYDFGFRDLVGYFFFPPLGRPIPKPV